MDTEIWHCDAATPWTNLKSVPVTASWTVDTGSTAASRVLSCSWECTSDAVAHGSIAARSELCFSGIVSGCATSHPKGLHPLLGCHHLVTPISTIAVSSVSCLLYLWCLTWRSHNLQSLPISWLSNSILWVKVASDICTSAYECVWIWSCFCRIASPGPVIFAGSFLFSNCIV